MSKITSRLIDVAATHAETVLIRLHRSLMPTWVLVDAKNHVTIVGTPWKDDQEKAISLTGMRKEIRNRKVVAYSFVCEAWRATVPPNTDLTEARAFSSPNKQEVVMALASDGEDQEWQTWEIQRDWNEMVTGLLPVATPDVEPESVMFDMLKKVRN